MKSIHPARLRIIPTSRGPGFRHRQWLLGALLCAIATPAFADIFNVNTGTDAVQDPAITDHCAAQGDTSHCTLRAAIKVGNTRAGAHTINISVPLITVINGGLPTLMATFIVNGNHATIDGNGHGCFDLTDSGTANLNHSDGATGSQLLNLVIGHCSGAGISANGHDYVFTGNFIGMACQDLAGTRKAADFDHFSYEQRP